MCYTHNHNEKLCLTRSIKENYRSITEQVVDVKAMFLSLCADIDRHIRLSTGVEIREKMDEYSIRKLECLFPYLSGLTLEQWNRFVLLFLNLRNVNAHLYHNKPLYLDEDIRAYLGRLVQPETIVTDNGNELTIYGAYYVLVFLSQKYMFWPFVSKLMCGRYFIDMGEKKFTDFKLRTQRLLLPFCGLGKPIMNQEGSDLARNEYINGTLRRKLTTVFMGLEAVAIDRDSACRYAPPFWKMLQCIKPVADQPDLFRMIVDLRNAWFHGYWLEDRFVQSDGRETRFDLHETMEILKRLRDALIDCPEYDAVVSQIDDLGRSFLTFETLRLVEVSYKLLDSRLLRAAKVASRASTIQIVYESIRRRGSLFYADASALLSDKAVNWKVQAAKFSDVDAMPRNTVTEELKIIVLQSKTGFDIGPYHVDAKELPLCLVTLPEEFELPINGKKLKDYPLALEIVICDRIKVYGIVARPSPATSTC